MTNAYTDAIEVGSLFSGIGGFDLGFQRAGMVIGWQVEINGKARAVLTEYWPGVEKFNDVRNCGRKNLQAVNLVCGGFPCQDLSIAGPREGLAGDRSGLWFEFHRIIMELRPRWVVIENVPGLLSSNGRRDFAILLGGLTGVIPEIPERGWGNAGLARGPIYSVAYRVLDAQFFGVAQRRRRVFIVASLGNGCAAQVLFECESSARDSTSGRKKREEITRSIIEGASEDNCGIDVAGTLSARNKAGGFPGTDDAINGYVVPVALDVRNNVVTEGFIPTLQSKKSGGYSLNYQPVVAFGGNRTSGPIDVATAVNAHSSRRYDFGTETLIVEQDSVVSTPDMVCLRSSPAQPFIACNTNKGGSAGSRIQIGADVGVTLQGEGGGMAAKTGMYLLDLGVRRLTPLECERLQGFPDGWTAVIADRVNRMKPDEIEYHRRHLERWYGRSFTDNEVKKVVADSTRYRQLGNAVAVPVVEWIGRRIVAVDRQQRMELWG